MKVIVISILGIFSLVGFSVANAAQGDPCSTALELVSAQALTKPLPSEARGSRFLRAFHHMPGFVRSFLARRNASARVEQINRLRAEVAALMPAEVFAFMAYLPQRSYSYLINGF